MTNKNLLKLAEIGERKLLDDLNIILINIKQSSMNIQRNEKRDSHKIGELNEKIKIYSQLITTCKNCGLDVKEDEKIYAQITSNGEKYMGEKERISLEIIYSNTIGR